MTSITKLVERLEGAEGPSRELDAEITAALDLRPNWLREAKGTLWLDITTDPERPAIRFRDAIFARNSQGNPVAYGPNEFPAYTSSVDCALTLVPEGYGWARDESGYTYIFEQDWPHDLPGPCSYGHDVAVRILPPALALCIASLKARAAI